jgi:hypothetical protein
LGFLQISYGNHIMTLIFAFIVAHSGILISAGGVALATVLAWLHGRATGKASATAQLQPKIDAAQDKAAAATGMAAAQTELTQAAVASKQNSEAVDAMTDDEVRAALVAQGAARKD